MKMVTHTCGIERGDGVIVTITDPANANVQLSKVILSVGSTRVYSRLLTTVNKMEIKLWMTLSTGNQIQTSQDNVALSSSMVVRS